MKTTNAVSLLPIDPENGAEQELLHTQRVICGWKAEKVPSMMQQIKDGRRVMFWVCTPARSDEADAGGIYISPDGKKQATQAEAKEAKDYYIRMPILRERVLSCAMLDSTRPIPMADNAVSKNGYVPVGHISVDTEDFDANPTPLLGSKDGSTVVLTCLFILPCFRKDGIGSWAMRECEAWIRNGTIVPPGSSKPDDGQNSESTSKPARITALTLSTLAGRHTTMPGPDGIGTWELVGLDFEKDRPAYQGPWYERLGYRYVDEMRKWPASARTGAADSAAALEGKAMFDGDRVWWCEVWRKEL